MASSFSLRMAPIIVAIVAASGNTQTVHAERPAIAEKSGAGEILAPVRSFRRGDYDIEEYRLKLHDRVKIKMRGVYRVVGVRKNELLIKALPGQKGLSPEVWTIPLGRIPIGNHHKMNISELDHEKQTARISLEYKTRWHWWDFNF